MKTAREMINALTAAGVTQQTLADSADMSQATISQIAAGNSKANEDLYRAIYVIHLRLIEHEHPVPPGTFIAHSLRYEPPKEQAAA